MTPHCPASHLAAVRSLARPRPAHARSKQAIIVVDCCPCCSTSRVQPLPSECMSALSSARQLQRS
eukprot:4839818-Prorocentrum_lima.AAC.1